MKYTLIKHKIRIHKDRLYMFYDINSIFRGFSLSVDNMHHRSIIMHHRSSIIIHKKEGRPTPQGPQGASLGMLCRKSGIIVHLVGPFDVKT